MICIVGIGRIFSHNRATLLFAPCIKIDETDRVLLNDTIKTLDDMSFGEELDWNSSTKSLDVFADGV
jgi:hypothetical protein